MKILKAATAGTVESCDIMVMVEPAEVPGVEIELKSTVMGLYGKQIRQVIEETAADCQVSGVHIIADDRGALDCTVRARVKTALLRGSDSQEYGWTVQ